MSGLGTVLLAVVLILAMYGVARLVFWFFVDRRMNQDEE